MLYGWEKLIRKIYFNLYNALRELDFILNHQDLYPPKLDLDSPKIDLESLQIDLYSQKIDLC